MLSDLFHVPLSKIIKITWKGDGELFDKELCALEKNHSQFVIVNPEKEIYNDWMKNIRFTDITYPKTQACVIFRGHDIWFAKLFPQNWKTSDGYFFVDLDLEIPKLIWEVNEDLPVGIKFKRDPRKIFIPTTRNRYYNFVWYLDDLEHSDLWAVKCKPTNYKTIGECKMENLQPDLPKRLDVIFISYNEPNAEENWQRVKDKAPWAKRVDKVDGIFNAHKAAALLSDTDMFYVVDGDAYLVDEWNFDFQPGIFDRDCAFVWSSKNPINDLEYGYGGVKLFSRDIILSTKTWRTLDMFLGVMPKIKFVEEISCITKFNVDEFSTWRSAFRESVKLYTVNQMQKLSIWMSEEGTSKFGIFSVEGARAGYNFATENKDDLKELRKINDYIWLKKQFDKHYSDKRQ